MTKKYILTGAPGSGKSSTLLELESRGEYIIREAAEDVIKLEKKRGIETPWEEPDFQRKILHLQLKREAGIPSSLERVFIDRGVLDGLAYTQPRTEISREIQWVSHAYEGVFLIENIGSIERNGIRRETYDEALELEKKLTEIYLMAGYRIIKIPSAPVKDRAETILWVINSGVELR